MSTHDTGSANLKIRLGVHTLPIQNVFANEDFIRQNDYFIHYLEITK